MNDDPDFDGASLLVVGGRILEAARERPALGLALGRQHPSTEEAGQWFIGTRVARAPERLASDIRFDGGAPPLSALARRITVGEFSRWFGALKADDDGGRVYPVRAMARSEPISDASRNRDVAAPAEASDTVHRMVFPEVQGVQPIRAHPARR